jgi:hypothetical protein
MADDPQTIVDSRSQLAAHEPHNSLATHTIDTSSIGDGVKAIEKSFVVAGKCHHAHPYEGGRLPGYSARDDWSPRRFFTFWSVDRIDRNAIFKVAFRSPRRSSDV